MMETHVQLEKRMMQAVTVLVAFSRMQMEMEFVMQMTNVQILMII